MPLSNVDTTDANDNEQVTLVLKDTNTATGVSASPLRVDPTGTTPQPVTDNGGSLTVDGSVTVTQATGTNLHVTVDNFPATQNVAVTSSVEVEVKNDTGNPIPVNGTVAATQSGTWNINNVSGTVSLPTGAATSANQTTEITALQIIDDIPTAQNGAFVKGVPMMGQLDDTSTTAATEDNVAAARITAQRAIHTNLRNNAGTEIGTSANPVRIDPTGTTVQPVSISSISIIAGPTPTITRKTRSIISTASITAGAAYATMYTRSGSGLFFGFQADFNSALVSIKLTLDSDVIFEHTITDLKTLQFNDTGTTRFQLGGWWGTVGNTIDFSPKHGIPYATTVLIEIKRTDATNHANNNYVIFLTQET